MKEDYLNGRGRGSNYLVETWFDFGYVGAFIFSIILGIILLYMVYGFGKRALLSTIILVSLQNIFFIPRAEATWMVNIYCVYSILALHCCMLWWNVVLV